MAYLLFYYFDQDKGQRQRRVGQLTNIPNTGRSRERDKKTAAVHPIPRRSGSVRPLWTAFGVLSLGIAGLGTVLPLLPTTPLVILAAFAFSKGSPRLAHALHRHHLFGPIIAEWRANGAIALRYKVFALSMMGSALAVSAVLSFGTAVLVVQALAMIGAAAFILSRPNGAV